MARILVVDDDAAIRDLLELTLEEKHRTTIVDNGRQALDALDGSRYDLAVVDIMMPEIDGFELLTRIRNSPLHSEMPVVLLTAKVSEDDYLRGWRSGADAYISKPFDPGDLEDLIIQVLNRSPEDRVEIRESERSKAAFLRRLEHRFS